MASVDMPAVKTATISQRLLWRAPGAEGEGFAMNLPFKWTIRDATPDDAAAIAAIMRECWPDDTPELQRITRLIRTGWHVTRCAFEGATCIGFVDAFPTLDAAGSGRWEIDLLAVNSSERRQGVGRALIAEAVAAAAPGSRLVRGLIRAGNGASERAFAAAGFQAGDQPLTLYVAPALAGQSLECGHAISVQTLTYSGLWLEGSPTANTLRAGRAQAADAGVEQVGVLVADYEVALCEEAGYRKIGAYRWFVRRL